MIDIHNKCLEQGVFLGKSVHVFGLVDGEPGIIRRGAVLPDRVPEQQWSAMMSDMRAAGIQAYFHCPACVKPVMMFRSGEIEAIIQCCQCTIVAHQEI